MKITSSSLVSELLLISNYEISTHIWNFVTKQKKRNKILIFGKIWQNYFTEIQVNEKENQWKYIDSNIIVERCLLLWGVNQDRERERKKQTNKREKPKETIAFIIDIFVGMWR